jgi:hypothetical protein
VSFIDPVDLDCDPVLVVKRSQEPQRVVMPLSNVRVGVVAEDHVCDSIIELYAGGGIEYYC